MPHPNLQPSLQIFKETPPKIPTRFLLLSSSLLHQLVPLPSFGPFSASGNWVALPSLTNVSTPAGNLTRIKLTTLASSLLTAEIPAIRWDLAHITAMVPVVALIMVTPA